MDRYLRNEQMLSREENINLSTKTVAIIGCGGLGGYIIEMLGRLGVGTLKIVDGDVFDESNLNRQILSNIKNIGKNKAIEGIKRMKIVNPDINIIPYIENLDLNNAENILKNCDVVIDALDNISSRLILEEICEYLKIPMVHGAITGWYGQVSTILPGDKTLEKIYSAQKENNNKLGNPSFTPALIASFQVSETLKIIIGRGKLLSKKIMFINLYDNDIEIVEI